MGSLLLDSPELRARYDRVSTRQFEHGKQLIQELGIGHGQRVLDVGCGTGLLGVYVAGLVGTHGLVVGVDPVPLRVTLARLRAQAHFQVHLGRAEELDALESDSFDAAFLNSVIHCLDDRETVLTGIYRVLRAGGKVGFTAIDRDRLTGVISPCSPAGYFSSWIKKASKIPACRAAAVVGCGSPGLAHVHWVQSGIGSHPYAG